ncbi:MAG: hypothetical protein HPM95_06950 [Alphaproteobacteria bacterium]|nr:hypothetical protein [Alphaproteobacteria bacterium]
MSTELPAGAAERQQLLGNAWRGRTPGDQPSSRFTVNAKIEYRHNWFRDSATYQTVSNRNGYEISGRLSQVFALDDTWSLRAAFLGGFENAKASFETNWHAGRPWRDLSVLHRPSSAWKRPG